MCRQKGPFIQLRVVPRDKIESICWFWPPSTTTIDSDADDMAIFNPCGHCAAKNVLFNLLLSTWYLTVCRCVSSGLKSTIKMTPLELSNAVHSAFSTKLKIYLSYDAFASRILDNTAPFTKLILNVNTTMAQQNDLSAPSKPSIDIDDPAEFM